MFPASRLSVRDIYGRYELDACEDHVELLAGPWQALRVMGSTTTGHVRFGLECICEAVLRTKPKTLHDWLFIERGST